jgi:hypothetical protein
MRLRQPSLAQSLADYHEQVVSKRVPVKASIQSLTLPIPATDSQAAQDDDGNQTRKSHVQCLLSKKLDSTLTTKVFRDIDVEGKVEGTEIILKEPPQQQSYTLIRDIGQERATIPSPVQTKGKIKTLRRDTFVDTRNDVEDCPAAPNNSRERDEPKTGIPQNISWYKAKTATMNKISSRVLKEHRDLDAQAKSFANEEALEQTVAMQKSASELKKTISRNDKNTVSSPKKQPVKFPRAGLTRSETSKLPEPAAAKKLEQRSMSEIVSLLRSVRSAAKGTEDIPVGTSHESSEAKHTMQLVDKDVSVKVQSRNPHGLSRRLGNIFKLSKKELITPGGGARKEHIASAGSKTRSGASRTSATYIGSLPGDTRYTVLAPIQGGTEAGCEEIHEMLPPHYQEGRGLVGKPVGEPQIFGPPSMSMVSYDNGDDFKAPVLPEDRVPVDENIETSPSPETTNSFWVSSMPTHKKTQTSLLSKRPADQFYQIEISFKSGPRVKLAPLSDEELVKRTLGTEMREIQQDTRDLRETIVAEMGHSLANIISWGAIEHTDIMDKTDLAHHVVETKYLHQDEMFRDSDDVRASESVSNIIDSSTCTEESITGSSFLVKRRSTEPSESTHETSTVASNAISLEQSDTSTSENVDDDDDDSQSVVTLEEMINILNSVMSQGENTVAASRLAGHGMRWWNIW